MQNPQITITSPEGVGLVLAVAALYLVVRTLPRLIAGRGAFLRPLELRERLVQDQDLLLLDIRSPEEFNGETGHLTGSVNLPLEHLRSALAGAGSPYLKTAHGIVTICRSDARAAIAARILKNAGCRNVRVLSGGISAWLAEGLPAARKD